MTQDRIDINAELRAKGVAEGVRDLQNLKTVVESLTVTLESLKRNYSDFLKTVGNAKNFNAQLKNFATGGVDASINNTTLTRRLNLLRSIQDQQTLVYNQQAKYLRQEADLYKSLGLINATNKGTSSLASSKNDLALQRQVAEIELGKQQLRYINKTTSGVNIAKDIEKAEQKIRDIDSALQKLNDDEKAIAQSKKEQLTYQEKLEAITRKVETNQAGLAAVAKDDLRAQKASQLTLARSQLVKEELILANISDKTTAEYKAQQDVVIKTRQEIERIKQLQTSMTKTPLSAQEKGAAARAQNLERIFGDYGASLFKIQAGLYLNYGIQNALFNSISFGTQYVIELDKAFFDLQATIAATDMEMSELKDTIEAAALGTRFSAVEVANAAKILGQAGFSAQQIKDSIGQVVLLATATGETLEKTVDVASSTISVFNLRAEDMGHVANVLTGAINETKLTIDKLAYGIQYAGNIAHGVGVTFEETVAILGAMSNAGILSGSTLGTGLRQVLIELTSPSDKLKTKLSQLGISLEDIDIKSRGIVPVLKTLRDAGFDTADAFESLDVRGAAAFSAIIKQPEIVDQLTQAFLFTNAAAKANETQMRSLSNIVDAFKNAFGALINVMAGPGLATLKAVTSGLTDIVVWLANAKEAALLLGAVFTGVTVVRMATFLQGLVLNLLGFGSAATAVAAFLTGPWGLAIAGVVAGLTGLFYILDKNNDAIDRLQGNLDKSKGEYLKTQESVDAVEEAINRLATRYASLKNDSSAVFTEMVSLQTQFGELGLTIDNQTNPSIDNLISALQKLRGELQATTLEQLKLQNSNRALLFQEQASRTLKSAYQRRGSIVDAFVGDITGTRDNSSVFGSNSPIASFLTQLDLGGISGKTLPELEDIKRNSVKYISEIQARLTQVNQIIENQIRTKGKADSDMTEEQRVLKETLGNLQEQTATVTTYITDQMQLVNDAFKSGGFYDDFKKHLDGVQTILSDYSNELSEAKTPEDRTKIEESKKEFLEYEKEFITKWILDQHGEMLQVLSEALGRPVSADELKRIIGAELDVRTTAVLQQGKNSLDKSSGETEKAYNAMVKKAEASLDNMTKIYSHINDALDRANNRLDYIQREASDLTRGGLRFAGYSDQELEVLKDQQRNNNIQKLLNRKNYLPQLISQAGDLVGERGKALNEIQLQTKTPDQKEKEAEALKSYNDALDKRRDLENELTDVTNEYLAMTGQLVQAHKPLLEQIGEVIRAYSLEASVTSSWAYDIRANVRGVLDDSKGAFKDFVTDVVKGTKTIGQGFRSLISSILESLLNRTTDKLAGQLVGWAGDIFGSFVGGGVSADLDATFAANPDLFYRGGIVKANKGAYIGRDNTLVMAQKGEGILNRAAMSVIGEDTFNQINSRGNTKMAMSAPAAAQKSDKEPDTVNVYVISPDQKPSLSKRDVVVTIADDIQTGGPIKKLIKSVQLGQT